MLSSVRSNTLRRAVGRFNMKATFTNITYSGGQAYDGQGGFCGSAGANKVQAEEIFQAYVDQAVAHAEDLKAVSAIMNEIKPLLNAAKTGTDDAIDAQRKLKKMLAHRQFIECLERLEYKSEPVWGLSIDERKMVSEARATVNEGF
mmetsp:Transcript_19672/g.29247  ORF Transcript_19672/g.29247 Transcript_19672/m.29247 type:complete len:146 (-) Transcript_19672:211-648(-)|eukprot:CAMPEP_0116011762 /NCGR_PEP_ID=MMETSP0321-20121206/4749_1 /TAXON_ID=163516 /ORGANISM="Leptocylindrus danicus var. danicus, Strain B650" /LENGTH=145 /DNA_ID=CAMNT_0003481033 /DNA_START=233 /DNA_END=673 /DNA_ORIENTATION=+